MKLIIRSLLILSGMAVTAAAESVTFKQGADVLSSDGFVDITDYQGTEDSTLIQDSANNNYGGRNEILLGPLGGGKQRAGLIRFDVTSMVGIYQTIDSVKLRFTVVRLASASTSTWNINLLREGNAGWVEGTANGAAEAGSPSWNYLSYNTTEWLGGKSGARLAADVYGPMTTMTFTSSTLVGDVVELTLDPSSLDPSVDTLTEIIDLWSGGTNAGIQIYGGSGQWGVASSEAATIGDEPELLIEYTSISSGNIVRPGMIDLATLTLANGETSILRPGVDLVTVTDTDGFSVGAAPGETHTITLERTVGMLPGTYPVIDYDGTIGGAGFAGLVLDVPPHVHATLVNNTTDGTVDIDVTGIDPIVWDGDAGTPDWDESTLSFKVTGGSQNEAYFPGDDVIFDDSATNGGSVNVAVEVSPSSLVFDHDTLAYTLSGQPISGGTGLEKLGTGTLTLLNANTYTGDTYVDEGRMVLGDGTDGSLGGTGVQVAPGATLEVNAPTGNHGLAITDDGAVEFSGVNDVTRTAGISGSGSVAYTGSGTLILASANTFTGGLHVMSGTVAATGQNAKNRLASDSTVTVESGGTFDVRNTNALPTFESPRMPVSIVLNGGTLTASGAHNHTNLLDVTLNDGATMTTEPGVGVYNGENFRLNGNLTVGGASPSSLTMEDGLGLGAVAGYESHVFEIPDVSGDATADLTIDCDLIVFSGAELLKQGAGTMQFNGSGATFDGVCTIDEGVVVLGEFADLDACPRIEVRTGATFDVTALGILYVLGEAQTLAGNGTVEGSVDLLGTLDPGASVGTITLTGELTINSDSVITTEPGDWSTAEADLIVAGSVEIFADSGAPAVITIDGSVISNFSETNTTLTLVQTTTGISGFASDAFDIQTANFPGNGTWAIQQNGNDLELVYTAGSADPYGTWASAMGLDGSNNGFDQDAEGDGVDNGLEWILGGDPLVQDAAAILPATEGDAATGLTLAFTREEDSIGQATLTVDWDSDLDGGFANSIEIEEFDSTDPGTGATVTIDNGATPDDVTVLIPATNAIDGKIFARLRAER
jgi:autotransporter-associated beta strand protein